jgi:hypothetical protein
MTQELANALLGLAASLSRSRRRVGTLDPSCGEIDALDDALEEPIRLARRLCVVMSEGHQASSGGADRHDVRCARRG